MSKMIKFKVDGFDVEAEAGSPLLDALLRDGFDIPHLCHHEAVAAYGSCRLCLVEITRHGRKRIATSCNYPVMDGIEIVTHSEKIDRLRRTVMELHLAATPASEPLKRCAESMGVTGTRFKTVDPANDCILCGLCERVCSEVVGVHAIGFNRRGGNRGMAPPYLEASEECIACGACVYVCPVDCIRLEQTASHRFIDRWGKSAPLQKSEQSGLAFAPRPQLEYFARLAGLPGDFYRLAPGERSYERE
jgi:bidirectional [NiFe] hydrogenase diaphorase subunit